MDRIDRRRIVKDFAEVINRNNLEIESSTPDFILAEYLFRCLENWNDTVKEKGNWYAKPLGAGVPPQ